MPIQVLPPELAAKIAAGEVIERPASVVKELFENAIDAGAEDIHVAIAKGGRRLMRVSDDGSGIPSDQVEIAFQRHATSKLSSAEELYRIRTLGFRGEALASIAAVSRLTLTTQSTDESIGTRIRFEGGTLTNQEAVARNRGTDVQVENLFFNTPARLKFLRTDATESGHVARLISSYSLAFPKKRIELRSNDRLVSRTTGTGSMRDVVLALYGLEIADQMLEIAEGSNAHGGISVWGLVSAPGVHRSNRRDITLFVNQRWIQDNTLTYAITQAYRSLLPQGRHPLIALNISVPPEEVDVNIHPTKQEVRFRNQSAVFAAVQRAVRNTLMSQQAVPSAQLPGRSASSWTQQYTRSGSRHLAPGQADAAMAFQQVEPGEMRATEQAMVVQRPLQPTERLPMLRVVGQIAQTYIIAEGPAGLYLIDQHAAHERVRYETLQAQRASAQPTSQELLSPLTIELSPEQATLLQQYLDEVSEYGFDAALFGHNVFVIRAAPAGLPVEQIAEAMGEILDAAEQGDKGFSLSDQVLTTLSCHTAIRAGQTLSLEEMRDLVRQLERAALPHTCPHGRPTMIHLSQAQLERQFLRQ